MEPDIVLSPAELEQLTGYRRPGDQLAELLRLGFARARRSRAGAVVLERAHYLAVASGQAGAGEARPRVRPPAPAARRSAAA